MRVEIKDDILLPAHCNYRLSFPEALKRGVHFAEQGDEAYPFLLDKHAPHCVSVLGRVKAKSVFLASSQKMDNDLYREAEFFAAECAYAGIEVIILDGTFIRARETLVRIGKPPVLLLSTGILEWYTKRRNYKGAVISPFLPYTLQSKDTLAMRHRVSSYFPVTVFFGCSYYEFVKARRALDAGGDVYLHRSALQYPFARALALEGAPVIDHVDNRKGIVYRDDNDCCSFLKF